MVYVVGKALKITCNQRCKTFELVDIWPSKYLTFQLYNLYVPRYMHDFLVKIHIFGVSELI